MGDRLGFGTWNGATMMVPVTDERASATGNGLRTSWHSVTSAIVHLTGRHRTDLDSLVGVSDR